MAGAMQLGQHMHDTESRIEHLMRSGQPSPQQLEDLLARHDYGLHLFESVQNPLAAAQAEQAHGERRATQRPPEVDQIVPHPAVSAPALVPLAGGLAPERSGPAAPAPPAPDPAPRRGGAAPTERRRRRAGIGSSSPPRPIPGAGHDRR
jgi:chemosensory pili system protein ChpA (sensor histidine kinase/response regulator)